MEPMGTFPEIDGSVVVDTELIERIKKLVKLEVKVKTITGWFDARNGDASKKFDVGSLLLQCLECWEAGLEGRMPEIFTPLLEREKFREDPEWGEYLRLKEKFKKSDK